MFKYFLRNNSGFSIIMVLLATSVVLTLVTMLAVVMVSEMRSFDRYSKTTLAYSMAKKGITMALANLNAGKDIPVEGIEFPVEGVDIEATKGKFNVKFDQNTNLLVSEGQAKTSYNADGTERFVRRTISVKLIKDPQTSKFSESFSSDLMKGSGTNAFWGDGVARLNEITVQGDGSDGNLVIDNGGIEEMPYVAASLNANVNQGDTTVQVRYKAGTLSGNKFKPGDIIKVMQMKYINRNSLLERYTLGVGEEESEIESIASNGNIDTLTLTKEISNTYFFNKSNSLAQVVKIFQFNNVTVTNNTTGVIPKWDFFSIWTGISTYYYSGGVLLYKIKNNLTINSGSQVDLTGTGYMGYDFNDATYSNLGLGPGTPSYYLDQTYDRFSGGAYGGDGGRYAPGAWPFDAYAYGSSDTVSFMGSGGGGNGSNGGQGGGLVNIVARNININGKIQSNGSGELAGGSAGGGIRLKGDVIDIASTGVLSAAGGGGGGYLPTVGQCEGPVNKIGANGADGIGGNGGIGSSDPNGMQSSLGGMPGSPPGNGGSLGNFVGFEHEGGFSAGGAGGGSPCNLGLGAGGGAGRILIKYDTSYNGIENRGVNNYYPPSGTEVIGPYAYFIDEAFNETGGSGSTTYINNKNIVTKTTPTNETISGINDKIRSAKITIFPTENSYGEIRDLRMLTSSSSGTIESPQTTSFNISSGEGPVSRIFNWSSLGKDLVVRFKLYTDDVTKTPEIDHITITYSSGKRFAIDFSSWRAD